MEWYWWVVILAAIVAIGIAKYFIMKKYNSKKSSRKANEDK